MKKRTKGFLIGAAITAGVAAIGTFYHATAKTLLKIALDREEPKSIQKGKEKLMGSKELSDILAKLANAAGVLENAGCETVECEAADGVRLVGHWYFPKNPKRIIVAMHGWRSSWSRDFGIISPFWHENDCAVLYAEQRAQGSSGGDYMGFGLLERYDCFRWIEWVNERTGAKLPIYLGGISMGASTVLMTAGLNLPQNVHGIVADCGFTSADAIWKHVVENNLRLPYGLYSGITNEMCKRKLGTDHKEYSCLHAMKDCHVPVLFIHGTDDNFVPVDMTYENYKACVAEKHLLIVPGADHGMSYLVDKAGYENAVLEFFQLYDK